MPAIFAEIIKTVGVGVYVPVRLRAQQGGTGMAHPVLAPRWPRRGLKAANSPQRTFATTAPRPGPWWKPRRPRRCPA